MEIIHLELGNDAFNSKDDVAELLVKLAKQLRRNAIPSTLYDINGNKVGVVKVIQASR